MQFPDEYLEYSVPVFQLLSSKLPNRDLYVLADTSYGSCCVDEVAAQHVDADVVVHYGHACLSQTSGTPTIYVFGKLAIDIQHCVSSILACCRNLFEGDACTTRTVFLMYNVAFTYQADDIRLAILSQLPQGVQVRMPAPAPRMVPASITSLSTDRLSENSLNGTASSTRHHQVPNDLEPSNSIIFYVGGESMALTNVLLLNSAFDIYSYDPERGSARLETGTNSLLMRRYAILQKARDADIFGILVGTLGVSLYLPLIAKIRRLLRLHHKKSYTLSVGKLNPSKLANFMEIECFVYVACPENSIVDSKDFFRPIITPHELDLALQNEVVWPNGYMLDFHHVLAERFSNLDASEGTSVSNPDDDEDAPRFSLISGKYRHPKRYGEQGGAGDGDGDIIMHRVEGPVLSDVLARSGSSVLQRTFQGLDASAGTNQPSVLEQGRSGVAQGYNELAEKDSAI